MVIFNSYVSLPEGTVDGCEILHQLKTVVYPIISRGKNHPVVQDFATIHSMYMKYVIISQG